MCSLEVFNLVNDGVQRTNSKPGTIIKELSRKTGLKESVLYNRYRNLNTGRRTSSKDKAQVTPELRHDNQIPNVQVPPPKGEEKSKPEPGTVTSILDEIDAQIQNSRDSQPKCFGHHGTAAECGLCGYALPCGAAGQIDTEAMEREIRARLNDDTPSPPSTIDLEEAIRMSLSDDAPTAPKTDREIFQALQRPVEWTNLVDIIRKMVSDSQSKVRMAGLSPKVAAFDLTLLAKELGEGGLRAALDDE